MLPFLAALLALGPATAADAARYPWLTTGVQIRPLEEAFAPPDRSRRAFLDWLDLVFTYAGTVSLERETTRVARADVEPGDVLVVGGSPGHAVLVLDVAAAPGGEKVLLLGEGYTPAQELHVLRGAGGPWFPVAGEAVATPFWSPFPWSALRRLPIR